MANALQEPAWWEILIEAAIGVVALVLLVWLVRRRKARKQ
jgi:uncharacterized protein (TIGR03382 family)